MLIYVLMALWQYILKVYNYIQKSLYIIVPVIFIYPASKFEAEHEITVMTVCLLSEVMHV